MIRFVAKLEGKSNTIRGQLFELVAGHIVHKSFGGNTYIGKKIRDENGDRAEIDVLSIEGNKAIRIIECKGNNSNNIIDLPTINLWELKIRIIRNWIEENTEYKHREQHFEYWTTGGFDPEASAYLDKIKASTKKFTIDYKAFPALIELASSQKLTSICDLLREHYSP